MNEHGFFKVMREGALLMQVPKWLWINLKCCVWIKEK